MPFRSTLSNLGYSGHIILAGWLAYDGVMFWKRQTSFNQEYAAIQDMDSVGSHSSANPPLEQPSHHWGCGRVMLGFAWQVMLCTAMFLAGSVITAAILPRQHQFHRPGTALSTDRQCAAQLGVYCKNSQCSFSCFDQQNFTNVLVWMMLTRVAAY